MEITEAYLKERLSSLEARLGQFQNQLGQAQQMVVQSQANMNAVQGAIADTKEMMAYLHQKEPVAVEGVKEPTEQDIMDVKPAEA
jgi:peptidoglycan hydrolase CwlO-like protein